MKHLIVLFLAVSLFSCKDEEPFNTSPMKFNPQINTTLTYSTSHLLEKYDDFGNVIDTLDLIEPSITTTIVGSLNDSILGFTNLVRYDVGISKNWYMNTDSGFIAVAYTNAGVSDWVFPKRNGKQYLSFNDYKKLILAINNDIMSPQNGNADSIQYYESPRMTLKYPLFLGQKWQEFTKPFFLQRERVVVGMEVLTTPAGNYYCYKNRASDEQRHLQIDDYFNLELGLIKRVIFSDSLGISNETSPEPIYWGRFTTTSVLIRRTN